MRLVGDNTVEGIDATKEIRSYAETTVSVILVNYQSVEGIDKDHGFLSIFVIQPSILSGRKVLSATEQKILEEAFSNGLELGRTILTRLLTGARIGR